MNSSLLFIIPSLNHGGAEMLLVQQVKWLKKNGWKPYVAILSPNNSQELIDELGVTKEQLLFLNSESSILNFSSLAFALLHKKQLIDFAYLHNIQNVVAHLPLAHFWGRLLKLKMPEAKLLVYHHSMQYQASPLNTISKKIFNRFQKILAAKADDISVCISKAVKDNIGANFILKNPVVLYNAVPDKAVTIALEQAPKDYTEDTIKLLFPGRLHPAKGHLFFLGIFKQLIKEFPRRLKLVIAGGGSVEEEITSFINSNNLGNVITMTGFIANDDLLKQLYIANIVVIPSLSEGLGIVGIEALMLGKTVVASDTGGLKEVFSHDKNGYLFEAGNYESCLNLFKDILSNYPSSLLPEAELRESYKQRFSFESYIKQFEALLKIGV